MVDCRYLLISAAAALTSLAGAASFEAAEPVWPEGKEREKNITAGFRCTFERKPGEPVLVRLTGATVYRGFLNGELCGYGPARGPHGAHRVDEWDLSGTARDGKNVLAVEVAGYNANSYYHIDQPSFLQAEVVVGGKVAAATSASGETFSARILPQRLQKIQRISFQRPFAEAYRFSPGADAWRTDSGSMEKSVALAATETKTLIPRRVPYPRLTSVQPVARHSRGTLRLSPPENRWNDRSLANVGPKLAGFPPDELETIITNELLSWTKVKSEPAREAWTSTKSLELPEGSFEIVDLGTNLTGFVGATLTCTTPTQVFLSFDEIQQDDDINPLRIGMVNAISLQLEPGTYVFESFEPYTLRYLKLSTTSGHCRAENVHLREYANDDVWQSAFACSDRDLNRLFEAGRQTYRQNAVDLFMDCPSRERAGWLCDSFFTARAARDFSGNSLVETNFLENFVLPKEFAHLPKGMLPMCYPADHYDSNYIPNWALWFVVELEEYLQRTGDRALVDAAKPKILELFQWFDRHKNTDGLLEKLPGWIFVEWSDANSFVHDVNYPTNMLYAAALGVAGRLYSMPELTVQAERIRGEVLKQSFDGECFVDNAMRKEGKLEVTRNRTEACQYYAFFFGVATPESHPKLWKLLTEELGPGKKPTGLAAELRPANAFMGDTLRTELLGREGLSRQLARELVSFFSPMADRTGTLWENRAPAASCNHGFESHVSHLLIRDVAGLARIDSVGKRIEVRIPDVDLTWCETRRPLENGFADLSWGRDRDEVRYRLSVPAGYHVEVTAAPGLKLKREE